MATELVKKRDWNLLQTPPGMEEAALLLAGDGEALLILPDPQPSAEKVRRDFKVWSESAAEHTKRWRKVTLLYLSEREPNQELIQALEDSAEKASSGSFFQAALHCPNSGEVHGRLPKPVAENLNPESKGNLKELLLTMLEHEMEMRTFMEKVGRITPWGTYAVMALCVATFAWATAAGGTENTFVLLRFGANYPPLTQGASQWWRLLGATFMHIGFVHLLVNMYSLNVVGPALETFIGNLRYLAIYTLAGLSGSLSSVYFGGGHVSAGASGAIFGLFGASVALGMRHRDKIPRPIQRALVKGMLPAIGYNLLFGFSVPGIDNAAHLGGLLGGALATALLPPAIAVPKPGAPLKAFCALVAGLLFLNQGLVLSKAYQGFDFRTLPAQTESKLSWGISIPKLLEKSEDGGYYQGPGVNLFFNAAPGQMGDPKEMAPLLSKDLGFTLQFVKQESIGSNTWYFYSSKSKVAGYYALTERDGIQLFIGAFCPPDDPDMGRTVVDVVVRTAEYSGSTTPEP